MYILILKSIGKTFIHEVIDMAYEIRPQSVSLTPSQAYTIYPAPAPVPTPFAPYQLEVLIFLLILMPLMIMPIFLIRSIVK